MKYLFGFIVQLFFLGGASAQSFIFQKTIGENFSDEEARTIGHTHDGNFILSGYITGYGAGSFDFAVFKIDSNANLLWSKAYGGQGFDDAEDIQSTRDSGFIAVGATSSFGTGSSDILLVKLDRHGNDVWSKTFGGLNGDYGISVLETKDGGLAIAAHKTDDDTGSIYLIKTDAGGNLLWTKTYQGSKMVYSFAQSVDGGFVICGTVQPSIANNTIFLMKVDSLGNFHWYKTYDEANTDILGHVKPTDDGGYIIGGGMSQDAFLIKTDDSGDLQWAKKYGGAGLGYFRDVLVTPTGYLAVGKTNSVPSNHGDAYLMKADTEGNVIWAKGYGGNNQDDANSVVQTNDGGYFIAGYRSMPGAHFDVYLIKTDSLGNSGCFEQADTPNVIIPQITVTSYFPQMGTENTSTTIGGSIATNAGGSITTFCGIADVDDASAAAGSLKVFPNPTNGLINVEMTTVDFITLKVYDGTGRLIIEHSAKHRRLVELDMTAYPAGLYYITASSEGGTSTLRFLKN